MKKREKNAKSCIFYSYIRKLLNNKSTTKKPCYNFEFLKLHCLYIRLQNIFYA